MATYSEKLRDPRWQKMRLEVLQRDDWACQICFDTKKTLNVHHRYYIRSAAPWEYPPCDLVTLCETCHREQEENKPQVDLMVLDALRRAGAFNAQIDHLASIFWHTKLTENEWYQFIHELEARFKDKLHPTSINLDDKVLP